VTSRLRGLVDVVNGGLSFCLLDGVSQGGVEDGKLPVGIEAAEGLLRLQEASGGPALRHLGIAPSFDVALHCP